MPNETIRIFHSHLSERDFTGEPIADEVLDAIVESGRRTPTHRHGQQISLVVVRNPDTLGRLWQAIAEGIAKDQQEARERLGLPADAAPVVPRLHPASKAPVFILIAVDFHKTSVAVQAGGREQHVQESLEGWTVGAVDAGITLGTLSAAARSFGLGAVAIGAIRHDPQPIIDLLGLPKWTYPVVGISIGAVNRPEKLVRKPRLPLSTYRHDERYDPEALTPEILAAFDEELLAYWREIGKPGTTWTERVQPYSTSVHPETKIVAARQGFTNIE
ncbi:NADPH-dependent oxidoreductase [Corticibacter populi]|uniref:NADPH-dependent oxidoreductase n=1 Tax=Corticibacter populi TaxID=1550736 RepID=A0A3M6QS39_9BURK|nr:nitroreductase family protein [Corticibacter populi]RMX05860.1 NADPH-dependent oxidoreductase [Corticibacter populi]RZS30822.1 FMN reductase [NAD(P)H] [Corticibacter populi]